MISILGIPLDENSSFQRGASKGPSQIIDAYKSDASNTFAENGSNCGISRLIKDIGSLQLSKGKAAMTAIQRAIASELKIMQKVISLGGDHSITFPIIQSYVQYFPDLNILHFDAHPDLYENFEDNTYSHASPFARIMENGLINRLVQVGIRTLNDEQKAQVDRYGIEVIEMKDFIPSLSLQFDGPVYISIDLDGLDPAFAPGVSHQEPGGLSTRELINVIHQMKGQVVGGDIVEYNPDRDINNTTATVSAKLLKELIGKMLI